jgi:hypothetical protein
MENKERLIIDNRTDVKLYQILPQIIEIMKWGRISNNDKQYCYLTTFKYNNEEYHIVTDLNKKSDKFTIYKPIK